MGHRHKKIFDSKHHIIPRSRGGKDSLENIAIVNAKKHNAYHELFYNKTPDEIVEFLVDNYWNGQWEHVDKAYRRNNE